MGGLERLFIRITPIFMLICFICLGITHTFGGDYNQNLTYMSEVYYDRANFQPINNPTPEQKETELKVYEFDTASYIDNIDINILKRATTNVLDIGTYTDNLSTFNAIWEDGYNFLDGVQTVINAVILAINTLILPINILLVPLRITAGIFLTAFSLVGININRQTAINLMLNGILDQLKIPLIKPTYNRDIRNNLAGSTWLMEDSPSLKYYKIRIVGGVTYITNFDMSFNFSSPSGGNYKRITTNYNKQTDTLKIWYTDTDNYEILVYENGWIYTDSKTVIIASDLDTTDNNLMNQLVYYLEQNAERQ